MRSFAASVAAPGNLPLELNAFVGRTAELAQLAEALGQARLVTVTGMGGVGKSRLAARAAAHIRPRDGSWRVELASVHDPHLVGVLALAAGPRSDGPHVEAAPRTAPRPSRRASTPAGRGRVRASGGRVRRSPGELLRHAPGCGCSPWAAGRWRSRASCASRWPRCPSGRPRSCSTDRAAARVPGFALDDGNRADVLELCRRLDGIPLAVELAAGRLSALSPGQLLSRLDDRFRLLTGGGRDALPRHQTLRTAIGWSHELCTPEERLLWSRLSVFAGPFDLEAVEYVCSGAGLHADDVLDVLGELLAQSVLAREETAAGLRYRMLDTVRAYGADWLVAAGDASRLRRRHRDWYMGLATWCELDWFSPRQGEVAARVETELPKPGVAARLEYSLTEPGETHLGQYLAGSLWFYWVGCGRLTEAALAGARVELDSDRDQSRLKALWVLGYVAILQGDMASALTALQECREEAANAPTTPLRSPTPSTAPAVWRWSATTWHARKPCCARRSTATTRSASSTATCSMAQVELAMALAFRGDLPGAVRLCEDVRRVCEDHGSWALAYALYVLAYEAQTAGDPGAPGLLQQSLDIGHAFHDLLGTVLAIELLALVTEAEGDPAEAALLQGAAARLWPSVGLPLFGRLDHNVPHERCEAGARRRLGDERYEECVRAGSRLGREAAVARALRRPGPRPLGAVPSPRGLPPDTAEPPSRPPLRAGRRRADAQAASCPL